MRLISSAKARLFSLMFSMLLGVLASACDSAHVADRMGGDDLERVGGEPNPEGAVLTFPGDVSGLGDVTSFRSADLGFAYVRARQLEAATKPRFHVRALDGRAWVAESTERGVVARFDAEQVRLGVAPTRTPVELRTRGVRCDDVRVVVAPRRFERGARANRVERSLRDESGLRLVEWYENGPLGIEQGFDVDADRTCDSFAVEIDVDGAKVELAGDAVRLVSEHGILVSEHGILRYGVARAVDASGRALEMAIAASREGIELRIVTAGARWPITIDPLVYAEEQRLEVLGALGADSERGDELGSSVAIEGDLAVVGASEDSVENVLTPSGAGYVFRRIEGVWTIEAKLIASDRGRFRLGRSVAASGDTIVLCAYEAAYVFVRGARGWEEQARLTVDGLDPASYFGDSVAISGDTIIIGAPEQGAGGSAYVFRRAGSSWSLQASLAVSDATANQELGWAVALEGDTAVVSARGDSEFRGAAYVFTREDETWTERAKLVASDGRERNQFGRSVALSGDTVVVGAIQVDGLTGAAYVFVGSGATWTQQARLVSSPRLSDAVFGSSVDVEGNLAVIGARGARGYRGASYVFERVGSRWTQRAELQASDGVGLDTFGDRVSLSGERILVGSPRAAPHDMDTGAAYVFALDPVEGWSEEAKLTAGDGPYDDEFGREAALGPELALVGATGADFRGEDSGAVHVYRRGPDGWSAEGLLVASDGTRRAAFGTSIALNGDRAVVGAPGHQDRRGAAYVFERVGDTWEETQLPRMGPGDVDGFDRFGSSVATCGDTVFVGAPGAGYGVGAVHVFVRSSGGWERTHRFVGASLDDSVGGFVRCSGDRLLLGARVFVRSGDDWVDESGRTFAANSAAFDGDTVALGRTTSIEIWELRGGRWTPSATIPRPEGVERFATRLALDGDVLLAAGSPTLVFEREGSTWEARPPVPFDSQSVAVDGTSILMAGSPRATAPTLGGPPPFGWAGVALFGRLVDGSDGLPCVASTECASGHCVDGVCCERACDGSCEACSAAAGGTVDGTCAPTTGQACDDGRRCTLTDACVEGVCVGSESPCEEGVGCGEVEGAFECGVCVAGTYSADGSGRSSCTPCEAGTWSAGGAIACAPWTTCGAEEREVIAPSAVNDRGCVALTVCSEEEFQVEEATSTSDRVCAPCMVCAPSEVEDSPCTRERDRVCRLRDRRVDGGAVGPSDAGVVDAVVADSGATDPAPSDSTGGCGCRAVGRSSLASGWFFAWLLVARRRRAIAALARPAGR